MTKERFYTADLQIPNGEYADIFKSVRICNNGSLVVCYREPIVIVGTNVGDDSFPHWMPIEVTPGAMVALDVRRRQ